MSGINDTLGHILLKSLAAKDLWERESLRLIPRNSNFVQATNNINVLIFVLHINLNARLCLAHTAYFIWSLWTSQKTLLASLSSNFFGDSNRGRGNSSLKSWLIVPWDELISARKMTLSSDKLSEFNSKNVANKLLHGELIFSFMKFNIILIFTMTDLSAGSDVIVIFSTTHWGKKLKISSF